ncbi:MAG: diaminopimelate epimerase [Bacteroidales bacterium OttesenSCG-928-I14]|jgi:diaminopimelate epimerase|nr:diaminopimelate epimerase [Bacteroidales bacterium OttesenSCG-928-I14]
MKFIKMHGTGNDYVYIDCFQEKVENPEKLAIYVSDRHKSIGSDGLVLIMPSIKCDFQMRMFNSDGSEAQMCGNAIRCVGKYVYDFGYTTKINLEIETLSGVKKLELFPTKGKIKKVKVNMGKPILLTKNIPVIWEEEKLISRSINFSCGKWIITTVSMGNPHTIIFTKKIKNLNIKQIGKEIENHPMFPEKTNVEFVEIISLNYAKMRVWERGSGETQSCGTGACAALTAGIINGKLNKKAKISLLGGELELELEKEGYISMIGDAHLVFTGEFNID